MEVSTREIYELCNENPGKYGRCKHFLKKALASEDYREKIINMAKLILALDSKGHLLSKETIIEIIGK